MWVIVELRIREMEGRWCSSQTWLWYEVRGFIYEAAL